MAPGQVIIIKKKRHHKHGHHGGAWKVAYADFVTAMMAFFLVMWIVAQSAATRAAVAAYFRDPGVFDTTKQVGLLKGDASGIANVDTAVDVKTARAVLEQAAADIKQALEKMPEFDKLRDQVEIHLTPEGLRIELLESEKDGFFMVGSSVLKPSGTLLLGVIARELGKLPNHVAVEGHTDSRPYQSRDLFSNWELSSERANAARREMQAHGLMPGQVDAVRGYADTRLRTPESPLDPRNRRISILVQHADAPQPSGAADSGGAEPSAHAAAPVAPAPPAAAPAPAPAHGGATPHGEGH
jgi:chemotaxis protein MotB